MKKREDVSVPLTGLALKLTGGKATMQAFHPLPDRDPCYRLIGLIAAASARIERLLDQSISYVAAVDMKVGACLTGQMNGPGPRFNSLFQLASNRGMSGKITKRIKTVQGHAGEQFE